MLDIFTRFFQWLFAFGKWNAAWLASGWMTGNQVVCQVWQWAVKIVIINLAAAISSGIGSLLRLPHTSTHLGMGLLLSDLVIRLCTTTLQSLFHFQFNVLVLRQNQQPLSNYLQTALYAGAPYSCRWVQRLSCNSDPCCFTVSSIIVVQNIPFILNLKLFEDISWC